MGKGSYIGGHTVLTQSRKNFESALAKDAQRHKRKVRFHQELFDLEEQKAKEKILQRIERADAQMRRPHHRKK